MLTDLNITDPAAYNTGLALVRLSTEAVWPQLIAPLLDSTLFVLNPPPGDVGYFADASFASSATCSSRCPQT